MIKKYVSKMFLEQSRELRGHDISHLLNSIAHFTNKSLSKKINKKASKKVRKKVMKLVSKKRELTVLGCSILTVGPSLPSDYQLKVN